VLAEMAASEGCTTNSLISTFHDEILEHRGEVQNFASFLRVTCMRYLQRQSQIQSGDHSERDSGAAENARRNVVPLAASR
jgi:predicted DNA-binding ribbon-helix-helix protein